MSIVVIEPYEFVIQTWKPIVGFPRYLVSDFGDVKNDQGKFISMHQKKTTKGTYINVNIINKRGKRKYIGVHQLVCRTFNGPPPNDGKVYEVNHKNHNKHDNRAVNTEWNTRSQNVKNVVKMGLRTDNMLITMTNVISGNTVRYLSILEAAERLGTSRSVVSYVCLKHNTVPLLGKWLFKIHNRNLVNKPKDVAIIYKCYIKNEVYILPSLSSAQWSSSVNWATIAKAVGLRTVNGKRILPSYKLINGCVFKTIKDLTDWPCYSSEEVNVSVSSYNNKNAKMLSSPDFNKFLNTLSNMQ